MKHLILLFSLLALVVPVHAETPEEKGLRIAQEANAFDSGFEDFTADMIMTLRNKKGDESVREIRTRTLEVQGDGDKSMSIFDKPRDVKGTAMLTFSHGLEPDDQWLYLPALKRVKRINSRNKSGPFMGSEFAYEDLSSQEVEKYSYKYLRDEACADFQCYVIEQYPQYEHSGYKRRVVWLDKEAYRVMKVVFYDRKDALLKTLIASGHQQYLDRYWRPDVMDMENHQTGKSTRLEWSNYQFKVGLEDRDFSSSRLKNIR